MITHANIGRMEAIGEVALNLLKGNIIVPTSSFKRLIHTSQSSSIWLAGNRALKRRRKCLIKKEDFYQL